MIDLSDNDIRILDNIPKLKRLKHLIFCNNLISRLDGELQNSVPNIEYLNFTNNLLVNLDSIIVLKAFKKLKHLVLLGNPLTKIKNYRRLVFSILPTLNTLDFIKITQSVKFK